MDPPVLLPLLLHLPPLRLQLQFERFGLGVLLRRYFVERLPHAAHGFAELADHATQLGDAEVQGATDLMDGQTEWVVADERHNEYHNINIR